MIVKVKTDKILRWVEDLCLQARKKSVEEFYAVLQQEMLKYTNLKKEEVIEKLKKEAFLLPSGHSKHDQSWGGIGRVTEMSVYEFYHNVPNIYSDDKLVLFRNKIIVCKTLNIEFIELDDSELSWLQHYETLWGINESTF